MMVLRFFRGIVVERVVWVFYFGLSMGRCGCSFAGRSLGSGLAEGGVFHIGFGGFGFRGPEGAWVLASADRGLSW